MSTREQVVAAERPPTDTITNAGASEPSSEQSSCCSAAEQASCCEPSAKAGCCGPAAGGGCGCR